jgi:hypothetical protein
MSKASVALALAQAIAQEHIDKFIAEQRVKLVGGKKKKEPAK